MKNIIILFAFLLIFTSCEKEQDTIVEANTADLINTVFYQKANVENDKKQEGLYRGIFSTHDLSMKGEIVLDLGNSKKIQAAINLIRGGAPILLKGQKDKTKRDRYIFDSERGTFTIIVNPNGQIRLDNFTFDNKDAYIVAYKETSLAPVSFSFGNYTDDGDPSKNGNWDVMNDGATYLSPPEHSTIPTPLSILEQVIISRNGGIAINSDGAPYNDSFVEPCFYNDTFQHGYYFQTPTLSYKELIAYNQTSTFQGTVATWSLAYYILNGTISYDTPTCGLSDAAGYGSWSWNGRSGRIKVERLGPL